MPTIADLRAANPWAEDISDLELLDYRAQQTGTSLEDAAKAFGVKYTPDRNAFMAGLSSGTDQLQGLGYGVLGAGARAVGLDSAADWADKNVRINNSEAQYNGRPDLENIEDQTLGSMPGYLVYQGAKQLPVIGGTIAAGAVMPEAVIPAALSRGLAFAPRAIGGGGLSSSALGAAEGYAAKKALTNEAIAAGNQFGRIGAAAYPMSVGSLYNEAVERGDPSQGDALAAFAAGVPYAAGEAVMPAMVTRGLGTGLGFKGNLATRMGKAAGVDAIGEAGTELFQNELEMGFAGPLTDEEAFSRRLNSAVAGGLVGGMYGAPAGIRKYRPPVAPGAETDLLDGNTYPNQDPLGLPAPVYTGTPSDQLLVNDVNRANDVAAAEQANRDLWAQRQAYEMRDIPVGTQLGLPLDGGRTGQVDPMAQAASGPLPAEYDPTNPVPNRRQMDLVFPETPEVLYGNQFNPASQPGTTGQQAGAFTQLPVTDEIRQSPNAYQQADTQVTGAKTVAKLKTAADFARDNGAINEQQHEEFYNTVDTDKRMKFANKKALLSSFISANRQAYESNGTQTQETVAPEARQQAAVPVSDTAPAVVNEAKTEQVVAKATQKTPAQTAPTRRSARSVVADVEKYFNNIEIPSNESIAALSGTKQEAARKRQTSARKKYSEGARLANELHLDPNNDSLIDEAEAFLAKNTRKKTDPSGEFKHLKDATPTERKYINSRMGWDENGNEIDNPRTLAEVATEFGVSHQAVSKVLKKFGITDEKITAAVATGDEKQTAWEGTGRVLADSDEVTEFEDLQNEAAKSQTEEKPEYDGNATRLADEQDQSTDLNSEDATLAEFEGATEDDNIAAEFANKLVDYAGNPISVVDYNDATSEYNSRLEEGDVPFNELSDTQKIRIAKAYVAMMDENIDFAAFMRIVGETADEALGQNGNPAVYKEDGVSENARSDSPTSEEGQADSEVEYELQAEFAELTDEQLYGAIKAQTLELKSSGKSAAEIQRTVTRSAMYQELVRRQAKNEEDSGRNQSAVRVSEGATDDGRADRQRPGATGVLSKDAAGSEQVARKSIAESANPTSVEKIKSLLKPLFFTNSRFDNKVTVVKSFSDLPLEALRFSQVSGGDTQAFVLPNGRAYMIADNIDAGSELAVFLHEVGVHLGMEKLLGGNENFLKLAKQIVTWYDNKDGSPESNLAEKAISRTTYAASTTPNFTDADYMHEVVAYFVEEAVNAGYTPTAVDSVKSGINSWLKTLWDYAKAALRKFGIDRLDTLTTQDVVDLAMAAAHLNMTGRNTEGEVGRAVRFSRKSDPSTPDGFFNRLGAKLQDLVDDPKAFLSRVKLGWMTLEQISDRIEKVTTEAKSAAVKKYVGVMTAMQQYSKDMVYQAAKIDQDWAKLNDNIKESMSDVMRTATRMSFDPEVETASTPEQIALQRKYNALPPAAKEVYKRVRDHYQKLFEERKAIMLKAAESGTLPAKNKAELEAMLQKYRGPYFPLMRLGNWYAVGMSNELADLQEKVDAGEASDEETKRYESLRKDKAHYITKSFDSRSAARRAQKQLAKSYDQSYFNTAKEQIDTAAKSVPDLAMMQDYLTSGMPKEAKAEMNGMLAQMYFDLLPEQSALKRLMKREGIYGEEEDMRKVFAASTISMSHHVSRLKYSTDLSAAMQEMKNLTKRDEAMTNVFNELVLRSNLAMKPDDSPLADRVTQLSYLANLGLSPAFILTNMSQVPMITAPWLTARYGFGNSSTALSAAFADAARIIKGTIEKDGWQAEYDWSKLFKEGSNQDRLLKYLLDMNLLDITMEHDFGVVSRAANSKIGKGYDTFVKASALPVRVTEVANRLITGLSTYNLESAKLQKEGKLSAEEIHTRASEMAAKAISETQLNYSALNAPRYMQTVFGSKALAKMVFQFRKYQQGMVYLIGKSAADAFKGDKEAAKTLFGLMTTTGLMAGATGLPFAGSAFWLATAIGSAFDDDDEPFDASVWFANYLADNLGDDVAQVVRKGLPTLMGLDLSNNVGMGNIGMPLPFIRNGSKPSDTMANMVTSSLGASFQMMQNVADGAMEMANGDVMKGAEKVIPLKGAKNIMKAYRYSTEGMTDSKGNVILPSEQFSPWDIAIRGSGFSNTKETSYYEANSAMQDARQAAKDVRSKLLRDYAEARMAGEDLADFQEKIADFNTRHPEKGIRIDQSSLIKSVQQRKRLAQERTSTGLRKDKYMKPYLERAAFADGE